jgi:Kef-type K+ transport system membrane component KefB
MNTILSLGAILVLGFLASKFTSRIKVPSITAYLILGVLIGPYLLNLVPSSIIDSSGTISNIALALIAFTIGQNFSKETLSRIGRQVVWISVFESVGAWVFVTFGLLLFGVPFYISIVFGAIAAASAPAAIIMVVRELKAKGRFTDILMGIVAIDDAWGLIIFSLSLAVGKALYLHLSSSILKVFMSALIEIGGAFILGGILALVLKGAARFIKNQTELLICTLGVIFLAAGFSILFGFSILLSCMFMSAFIVNTNNDSLKFFESIGTIDWPIYLLFFVLAGANLEIDLLSSLGGVGLGYLLIRVAGKFLGTYIGAVVTKVDKTLRGLLPLGLLPQAGVALGMALIAKDNFADAGSMIFTTIAATTIIYEIIGPIVVRFALNKSGEIG